MPNLNGYLSPRGTVTGYLSNATLRGIPVELRVNDSRMMQWRYVDEENWRDLIDLNIVDVVDYATLLNLPQIDGVELSGNKTFEDLGLTALTADEVEAELT